MLTGGQLDYSTFSPQLISRDPLDITVAVNNVSQYGNFSSLQLYTDSPIITAFSMTIGMISNIMALIILINAYCLHRRRYKATYLFLATSLVTTDFIAHMLNGSLVIHIYPPPGQNPEHFVTPVFTCQFLGVCMVFFGLCALFMGCAMAAERCLGVTKPLLHSTLVTKTRTKVCLCCILLLALCVAMLPVFKFGSYSQQKPKTWCFINVLNNTTKVDVAFVCLFSGLGLTSLVLALVFNTISGITLVLTRLRKQPFINQSTGSNDIEMVVQLVGITVTSCICWGPLLICTLFYVILSYKRGIEADRCCCKQPQLTYVRLAGLNQIMDPWVYILLRRTVLRKIYQVATCQLRLCST